MEVFGKLPSRGIRGETMALGAIYKKKSKESENLRLSSNSRDVSEPAGPAGEISDGVSSRAKKKLRSIDTYKWNFLVCGLSRVGKSR